jgi:hypothetical protein|tara:strand:+ start:354 stop:500 length:147 start_codon:yes stop_codon:yes gene_type:complete
MNNFDSFVQRLPNKDLEKLLIAIFEDKVRRKKLKLQGVPKHQWHITND